MSYQIEAHKVIVGTSLRVPRFKNGEQRGWNWVIVESVEIDGLTVNIKAGHKIRPRNFNELVTVSE